MIRTYRRLVAGTLAAFLGCGAVIAPVAGQETDKAQLAGVAVPETVLDLHASQIPVVDFLRSVSPKATGEGAQAGVRLVAGDAAEVERISAFAARMPLRDILANVATLYGWNWSSDKGRAGSGADTLTLGPSKERKAWERRHWSAMMDNALSLIGERVRADRETKTARLQSARALLQATRKPEKRDLRERQYLYSKASAAASGLYTTLSRPQRRQLLEQEELYLPWAQLTSAQRDFATTMVMPGQFSKSGFNGFDVDDETAPTKEERERFVNELTSRLTRTGITFSVTLDPVTGIMLESSVGTAGQGGYALIPYASALEKFEDALPPVRSNPYTAAEETPCHANGRLRYAVPCASGRRAGGRGLCGT